MNIELNKSNFCIHGNHAFIHHCHHTTPQLSCLSEASLKDSPKILLSLNSWNKRPPHQNRCVTTNMELAQLQVSRLFNAKHVGFNLLPVWELKSLKKLWLESDRTDRKLYPYWEENLDFIATFTFKHEHWSKISSFKFVCFSSFSKGCYTTRAQRQLWLKKSGSVFPETRQSQKNTKVQSPRAGVSNIRPGPKIGQRLLVSGWLQKL